MTIVLNGNTGITTPTTSTTGEFVTSVTGFKNRIINGAMVIDQRNAGASVTFTGAYTLDRYYCGANTDGTISVQQVSDAPEGFNNSIKFTVGTADASLAATQYVYFRQGVEGYNFADCNFGTANAKTVTVSFWVKSSVTGLFSGNLASTGHDRCYGYSFTINSANTWEYKTATIQGDTTGTWNKGKKTSDEVKKKQSLARIGKPSPRKGKKQSIESIEKIKKSKKANPTKLSQEAKDKISKTHKGIKHRLISCIFCKKTGGIATMPRWHLENCKDKGGNHAERD